MPRFLVTTTLSSGDLRKAMSGIGIDMTEVAPSRTSPAGNLLDVDLNVSPNPISSKDIRAKVVALDGVDQVLPVPDAKPG